MADTRNFKEMGLYTETQQCELGIQDGKCPCYLSSSLGPTEKERRAPRERAKLRVLRRIQCKVVAEKEGWSYSGSLSGSKKTRLCWSSQGRNQRNILSLWEPPKHGNQAMSRPSLTQRKCCPKYLSSDITVFPRPLPSQALCGKWGWESL